MEDPVFYQAHPADKPISLRQKKALLKKLERLENETARLHLHALELGYSCQKLGIVAPDFSSYALVRWESLLRGIKITLFQYIPQ